MTLINYYEILKKLTNEQMASPCQSKAYREFLYETKVSKSNASVTFAESLRKHLFGAASKWIERLYNTPIKHSDCKLQHIRKSSFQIVNTGNKPPLKTLPPNLPVTHSSAMPFTPPSPSNKGSSGRSANLLTSIERNLSHSSMATLPSWNSSVDHSEQPNTHAKLIAIITDVLELISDDDFEEQMQ